MNTMKSGSKKKRPAFLTDKRYQDDPGYANEIPQSRWHNIELVWGGSRRRFQMNFVDHPVYGFETRLGHVYDVNDETDEWVEARRDVLVAARADEELMCRLRSDVESIETSRMSDMTFE